MKEDRTNKTHLIWCIHNIFNKKQGSIFGLANLAMEKLEAVHTVAPEFYMAGFSAEELVVQLSSLREVEHIGEVKFMVHALKRRLAKLQYEKEREYYLSEGE